MAAGVEHYDDWDAVGKAAADTLERVRQPSLFSRLSWFRLIGEHAPPPGKLLALQAGGREGTWLFLAVEGAKARAYANWYSLRFSAVGSGAAPLEAIATGLKSRKPRIAQLDAYPLVEEDPLPAAFQRSGWVVVTTAASVSWTIDTAGLSFDAYWAARPSRLRNTAKRKAKAVTLDIEIHTSFDEDGWAAYEEVYAASWKGEEGSPAFLRALAQQEGAAGTLRLGIARHQGSPVAAQLWLVEGATATIHKLAYAESARDMSPGTLLSIEMFRHALDRDRVEKIDFGTGGDSYKADWMESSRPLLRMIAYNPRSARGLATMLRAKASKLVRRALNR